MDAEATDPRDADLVEHLGWVRRLALAQVRDRHAADDLVQEVARVWLEKRPALSGGPRSWLSAVTRRLAIDRARSDASRRSRERSASRPDVGTFEVVERGARQRRVFDEVLELSEPYRSTILYRYFDDLPTREVAQRMGVPEATVRKRVERGLALLRERLEREFGAGSGAWAVALLAPGLENAVWKGTGLMTLKWIAAAGAVLLLAGGAWYLHGSSDPRTVEEVGGTGLVVPAELAAAREPAAGALADAGGHGRHAAAAAATVEPQAGIRPDLRGFVFVDDVHTAPPGLAIVRKVDDGDSTSVLAVDFDAAGARWSIAALDGAPGRLWITSDTTVPAQIPIPPELWASGGVLDVHLSTGRTLDLTLVDRATKQPLPDLEFQVARSVVVARGRGQVVSDGNHTMHRSDALGRAHIVGLPLEGSLSVTVDTLARERDIVMRDGASMRVRMQNEPDFRMWLTKEQPARIEQTILVSPPLGEACASGQVPAWASAAAGRADAVRVMARETTRESPQARGIPFLLPCDAGGRFELCAGAPVTLAVWLERAPGRERISAETALTFAQPGVQDGITFQELQGRAVTLRFVHVPERGELRAWIAGKDGLNGAGSVTCAGADFTREFQLSGDDGLQLELHVGTDAHEKSGWKRLVRVGDERELTIDLGGSARTLRIESDDLGALSGDGALALLRVEDGEAELEQSILVLCSGGRGFSPVHVPNGRWLYRYEDANQIAVWGVVEAATAAQPGEELVLRPRMRFASPAEIEPAIRFDEIEGVGLTHLPEPYRVVSSKGRTERTAVPRHAKYVLLDGKH